VSGAELHWDFIRAVHMSVAALAVVPLQDALGLGSDSRMNTPGRPDGNWAWRARPDALDGALADRLRSTTATDGRLP
jgi:4-alpha-glucanotransferase